MTVGAIRVTGTSGERRDIEATSFSITEDMSGRLVLSDSSGVKAMFAAGEWASVERIDGD